MGFFPDDVDRVLVTNKLEFNQVFLVSIYVVNLTLGKYFNATRGDRREVVRRASPLLLFCWLRYMKSFSNSSPSAAVSQY